MFVVQVAPDFLSEASQMARALPGNFGPIHSELMKIFIDEFGYGVHRHKHSTLFERLLETMGLEARVHAYYYWYLPTSLLMTSYFYWVTVNKQRWYEYLGALWWIEAVVPHFNRQLGKLVRRTFGEGIDTEYLDEHVGIDMHHRRMVLEKLIRPSVERHGEGILADVVRGIESARLLGDVAERDYLEQIAFCEGLEPRAGEPSGPPRAPLGAEGNAREISAGSGFLIEPRVVDEDASLEVVEGRVAVDGGYLRYRELSAGESVRIPKGRMFGARVATERALVRATPSLIGAVRAPS